MFNLLFEEYVEKRFGEYYLEWSETTDIFEQMEVQTDFNIQIMKKKAIKKLVKKSIKNYLKQIVNESIKPVGFLAIKNERDEDGK